MATPIIKVEGLSKRFQLGATQSIWERLTKRASNDESQTLWALKDINFEVNEGEVLGVIGRNGAGKSTLLKVLSRIIEPTDGQCVIHGRVGSLLEVGTGFHPELTGRDNIFLNGAILGMSHAEIKSHFDEIVDFASVERFIDTPVKRYSSGMYVRLAFAVAAFLKPEVLLIDEVLAVGDIEFQKKCLGKMENIASSGRTIIFISHNMGMIGSLCHRAVLLDHGHMLDQGDSSSMITKYYDNMTKSVDTSEYGDEYATFISAEAGNKDSPSKIDVDIAQPIEIKLRFEFKSNQQGSPTVQFHCFDEASNRLFVHQDKLPDDSPLGIYESTCHIPAHFMNDKTYYIALGVVFINERVHVSFFVDNAIRMIVVEDRITTLYVTRGGYRGPIPGSLRPRLDVSHTLMKQSDNKP